jgi:hypothetical protein
MRQKHSLGLRVWRWGDRPLLLSCNESGVTVWNMLLNGNVVSFSHLTILHQKWPHRRIGLGPCANSRIQLVSISEQCSPSQVAIPTELSRPISPVSITSETSCSPNQSDIYSTSVRNINNKNYTNYIKYINRINYINCINYIICINYLNYINYTTYKNYTNYINYINYTNYLTVLTVKAV